MDKFEKLYSDVKSISFDDLSALPSEYQSDIADALDRLEYLIQHSKGVQKSAPQLTISNNTILMIERDIYTQENRGTL